MPKKVSKKPAGGKAQHDPHALHSRFLDLALDLRECAIALDSENPECAQLMDEIGRLMLTLNRPLMLAAFKGVLPMDPTATQLIRIVDSTTQRLETIIPKDAQPRVIRWKSRRPLARWICQLLMAWMGFKDDDALLTAATIARKLKDIVSRMPEGKLVLDVSKSADWPRAIRSFVDSSTTKDLASRIGAEKIIRACARQDGTLPKSTIDGLFE
jgi:hypothetical protein